MDPILAKLLNWTFVALFFGFCVFIHEFGHLIVALWRKMHVESFSIGFGKAIWKKRYRGVDYMISAIPFGGYVRLPQLDPSDEPVASDGKPLPRVKPIDRILVAVAGPLFNILFGFALGVVVWKVGVPGSPSSHSFEVAHVQQTYVNAEGETVPTPEAAAGLQVNDRVTGINGNKLENGFDDVRETILYATDPKVTLDIERDGEPMQLHYTLVKNPMMMDKWFPFFLPKQRVTCKTVTEPSAAYSAGIRPGDVLASIDGQEVTSTGMVKEKVVHSEGKPLTVAVRRDGQLLTFIDVVPRFNDKYQIYLIGIEMEDTVPTYPTPPQQFVNTLAMTYKTLRSLFNRQNPITVSDMSGPVGIVHAMSVSFRYKFMVGIQLVVLITFSLALINLFPIPVLDGGHITYGLIEMVTRRRVPTRVVFALQNVFAVLIISFFLFVTFKDVGRLVGPSPGEAPEKAAPAATESPVPGAGPSEVTPTTPPSTPEPAAP